MPPHAHTFTLPVQQSAYTHTPAHSALQYNICFI